MEIPKYEQGQQVIVDTKGLDHKWTTLAVDATTNTIYGFNEEDDSIAKTIFTHSTNVAPLDPLHEQTSSEVIIIIYMP